MPIDPEELWTRPLGFSAELVPSTLSLLRTMFEDDAERTKAIRVWGASLRRRRAIGR